MPPESYWGIITTFMGEVILMAVSRAKFSLFDESLDPIESAGVKIGLLNVSSPLATLYCRLSLFP